MEKIINNKKQNPNGVIYQIIGPIVDVKFSSNFLPQIHHALYVKDNETIVLEVEQIIGDDIVRCIAMTSTDGLYRGQIVINTKKTIQVPVGKDILGRIFNVIGQPIDGKGPIKTKSFASIYNNLLLFDL